MKNIEIIKSLKDQSTWVLFFLFIITYGVYGAYYVKEKSNIMNSALEEGNKISQGFINAVMVINWLSLALFIVYLNVDGEFIISSLVDLVANIMFIVWAFMARNRVNTYCGLSGSDASWFHGFWTFLFTLYYFNYKVNTIVDYSETLQTDTTESGKDQTIE